MIQITISGNTTDELKSELATVEAMLGGTSAKAVLSGSDQARLRGDATVVPPKGKTEKAKPAGKKNAPPADEEVDESGEAGDEANTGTDESDPLDDDASDGETLTRDDVKTLLIELRGAYPKDPSIITRVVKEHGKADKLSAVDEKYLGKIAGAARELLAKAKKK